MAAESKTTELPGEHKLTIGKIKHTSADTDEDDNDGQNERLLQVTRKLYTENDLDELYEKSFEHVSGAKTIQNSFLSHLRSYQCTSNCFFAFLYSTLPVLKWLQTYNFKESIVRDISAGLTVGILQIPQGMAYSMLTTLPAINGLYVSLIPVIVYFFLGTSRHGSLGTFAIVCLMTADVVESIVYTIPLPNHANPVNGTNITNSISFNEEDFIDAQRLSIAVSLSFLVGVIQIVMGVVRLGFVSIFLSDPLVNAFTTGAAFHVLGSQVKHFLGLAVPTNVSSGPLSLFKVVYYLFGHIAETNYVSLLVGIAGVAILLGIRYINRKFEKYLKVPIPGELVVVILGTGISYGLNFNASYDVSILKKVPKGIPGVSFPSPDIMSQIVTKSLTMAVVIFAINVSMVKALAKKYNYDIDPNQELIAYGFANGIGSFLSCFPSGISMSRSLLQAQLGNSQIASVFSVGLLILVLLSLAPLFEPLPKAVLASIVLVALLGLFKQFACVKPLFKISKYDGFIWIVTFLSVFLMGVDYGLAISIVANLFVTIFRTSRPSYSLIGQVGRSEIYRSNERYDVHEHTGIKIFQYSSPLFYANVEHFRDTLYKEVLRPASGALTSFVTEPIRVTPSDSGTDISDTEDDEDSPSHVPLSKSLDKMKAAEGISYKSGTDSISVKIKHPNGHGSNRQVHKRQLVPVHTIILDCSKMSFIDSMAANTLRQLTTEYKEVSVMLLLACCTDEMKDVLIAGGFLDIHSEVHLFVTVHDAVIHSMSRVQMRETLLIPSQSPETVHEHDKKIGRSFSVA